MRALIGVALLLLVFAGGWSSVVVAQADPFGYRPAVETALSEYQAGNFEEARAEFRRAHGLFPNARTLRGIGMAEFELRNYAECIDALQQALASTVRPLEGDLRAETERLLVKARNYVARVTFDVQPTTATVSIDGVVVTLDGEKSVMLRVGTHDVEVRADGHSTQRRELRVNSGQDQTLQVALEAPTVASNAVASVPVAITPSLPTTPAEPSATATSEGPSASPLPWIIVGGSAAVMIGGIVLVAMAQSDIAKVEDAKDGTTWPELESAYDGAPLKSGIGITLIGLGAAGVGVGVLLLLNDSDRGDQSSTQVAIGLGNASITGHF